MGFYITKDVAAHPAGPQIPAAGDVILYSLGGMFYRMDSTGNPILLGIETTLLGAITGALQSGDNVSALTNDADYQSQLEVQALIDAVTDSIISGQATQNLAIAGNLTANGINANNIQSNADDIVIVEDALDLHVTNVDNPHETTLLNLQDMATAAYTGGDKFFMIKTNAAGTGVELWESFERTASRIDPLLHEQTTFANYLTMTVDIPVADDYLLFMSHRFSLDATNINFESHVEYNGDFFLPTHVEPKDSFGTGIVVPNTTGGNTNTGTDVFATVSGARKFTLPAGTHTFNLEFRSQSNNTQATVYEAEMFIKRIAEV